MRVARRMPEGRFDAALRPGWMPHPPFLPAAALSPALPCAAVTDVRRRRTVIQGTASRYPTAWSERKPRKSGFSNLHPPRRGPCFKMSKPSARRAEQGCTDTFPSHCERGCHIQVHGQKWWEYPACGYECGGCRSGKDSLNGIAFSVRTSKLPRLTGVSDERPGGSGGPQVTPH